MTDLADLRCRRDRLVARISLVRSKCGDVAAARIERSISVIDVLLDASGRLAVVSAAARAQLH